MITGILLFTILAQIEGRVFTAGGNHAVPFAKVALIQSGQPVSEQYTDSLGRFRFPVVAQGRYFISVEHPEYERATVEMDAFSPVDHGNVTIELRPAGGRRGTGPVVMSLRDYRIPKDAQKEFDRARDRMKRGDCGKAIDHFEKGLNLYAGDAPAHNDLGNCYRRLEQLDRAEQSFKRAIDLGHSLYFSLNLAEVYLTQKRFEDAGAVLVDAIRAFPGEGDPYFALANVYFVQERLDDAEAMALEADSRTHRIADVHLLLAKIYLRRRNSAAVIRQLEIYLKEAPESPVKDRIRKELERSSQDCNGEIGTGRIRATDSPLKSRGGCASKKKNPFRNGADGVVRNDECFRNGFANISRT
ncbi:MAG TPA: tetratricopeptide repeat protein [Terriglobia bacterium]|nr:tetratricopeptide repeat protein [Terriglobia bacterium]